MTMMIEKISRAAPRWRGNEPSNRRPAGTDFFPVFMVWREGSGFGLLSLGTAALDDDASFTTM